MPAIRPPETMAMRSQVMRSSSSSDEIITTVIPLSRLNLGKANLLLVAAGELLGLLLRAGALDLQLVNIAVGHGADGLFIAPLHKAAKQALEKLIVDLHGREGNVPLQRLVEQQSHAAAVLRHKGKLRVETAAGRVERNGLAIELDGP